LYLCNCFENKNEYYDIKLSGDGHLSINYFTPKRWYEYIGFNLGNQKRTLTVSVPAKFMGAVSASTVSGDITMSNLGLSEALVVSTTSGEIGLKDIVASGQSSVSSVSGKVSGNILGDSKDYTIKATTVSGDKNLPLSTNGNKLLNVSTTSGDIDIYFTPAI